MLNGTRWSRGAIFPAMALLLLGCGSFEEQEPSAPETSTEELSDFQMQVADYLDVMVKKGPSGDNVLQPVVPMLGKKSILCGEPTEQAFFPARFSIMVGCLGDADESWLGDPISEDPEFGRDTVNSARMRQAAAIAKEKLDLRLASDPDFAQDRRALHSFINSSYDEALRETGVLAALERGWAEHVEAGSACFEAAFDEAKEFLASMREEAAESGFCTGWEAGLGVCTSESEEVAGHIVYHSSELEEEQLVALENLMKANLSYCLASVIETDPELAETVSAIGRVPGAGGSTPELNARVWKLWRAYGIEDLLNRTVENGGKVSKEDEEFIVGCILKKFPMRGES